MKFFFFQIHDIIIALILNENLNERKNLKLYLYNAKYYIINYEPLENKLLYKKHTVFNLLICLC